MKTLKKKNLYNFILIYQFLKKVFPLVDEELNKWRNKAEQCPNDLIKEQALKSIETKSFHAQGGSIFALLPGTDRGLAVKFIVAYQTISDYLDNLVDNMDIQDEKAFRQLHLAMKEALEPGKELSNYYLYFPHQNDGGYLETLVVTCQEITSTLPSYQLIKDNALWFAELYSNLQIYKHLKAKEREKKLLSWIYQYKKKYPEITEWEFAAATGSTLGIFCLVAAAFESNLTPKKTQKITDSYFPWINGIHILLDYFIDLEEDRKTNQLNFIEYYKNQEETEQRLLFLLKKSLEVTDQLEDKKFHETVVNGLLALYLSDPKSSASAIKSTTVQLLNAGGLWVKLLYFTCRKLRVYGKI